MININIGIRLQNARLKSNLTQSEVAKYLNKSQQYISKLECSKCELNYNELILLSDLYNMSLDYLFNTKFSNKY